MRCSLPRFITYCLFIALPADAFATCYTVYNSSDKAVYKSSEPPFDMSVSISENIKSKYPGGYLLQDNSASCSLPKAGDVTHESINAEVKKRNSDPRSRNISEVRTDKQTNDQIANGERIRGEMGNSNKQDTARDPKCEELLNELKNTPIDSTSWQTMFDTKVKRNSIAQEYELRCMSRGEREVRKQKRAEAQKPTQQKCSSDYDCGFGSHCAKPDYQAVGICMKTVDENGLQQYKSPRPDSVWVGKGQCSSDADCTGNFRCDSQYNACVKR